MLTKLGLLHQLVNKLVPHFADATFSFLQMQIFREHMANKKGSELQSSACFHAPRQQRLALIVFWLHRVSSTFNTKEIFNFLDLADFLKFQTST